MHVLHFFVCLCPKVERELKHLKCLRCKDVTMIVLGEEDLCDLR